MRRATHESIRAYWQNTVIRDEFWQTKFPHFVKPLATLYTNPVFAGTSLLTVYISDPASLPEMTKTPGRFGDLCEETLEAAGSLLQRIIEGSEGISLKRCAKLFLRAKKASMSLDAFAKAEPVLYRELQRRNTPCDRKRRVASEPSKYSLDYKF